MKFSSFKYLVKQGWHSMIANRLMTFASFGVLTACLVITGVAALLSTNLNSFMTYLGSQSAVEVFISDDADDAATANIESAINNMGETVRAYVYISKEAAVAEMQAEMEEYASVLEGYAGAGNPENPLPASFRVTVQNPEDVESVSKTLSACEGVKRVKTPTELSTVLVNMKKVVNIAGISLVLVLAVVSIVVISNTIRLTVFARRKEINIMKFVGATNSFIRLPFFVEGVTVGALSGILSSIIVCFSYSMVLRYFATPEASWLSLFTSCVLPINVVWPYVLVGFLLFGVVLGSVGTTSSIRKHLKV